MATPGDRPGDRCGDPDGAALWGHPPLEDPLPPGSHELPSHHPHLSGRNVFGKPLPVLTILHESRLSASQISKLHVRPWKQKSL